jgi:hypothetical protein
VAARPGRDDLVYLERRGDSYNWRMLAAAEMPSAAPAPDVTRSMTSRPSRSTSMSKRWSRILTIRSADYWCTTDLR